MNMIHVLQLEFHGRAHSGIGKAICFKVRAMKKMLADVIIRRKKCKCFISL